MSPSVVSNVVWVPNIVSSSTKYRPAVTVEKFPGAFSFCRRVRAALILSAAGVSCDTASTFSLVVPVILLSSSVVPPRVMLPSTPEAPDLMLRFPLAVTAESNVTGWGGGTSVTWTMSRDGT